MAVVKIKTKVVSDNTGIECELPTLLTEQGELLPLLDFLLAHRHNRSESWMNRTVHSAYLLLQYLDANVNCYKDPQSLFSLFTQRIYSGTIGEDGLDPSGLYWLPASTKAGNGLVTALSKFTDWLEDNRGATNLNPLRLADSYEQRLN